MIEWPIKILYGDTDSCYYLYEDAPNFEEADRRATIVVKALNDSYREFASQFGVTDEDPCYLEVKLEHVYDGFLQTGSKKRYACIYRDPNGDIEHNGIRYVMKVRGFEVRKSNASKITRMAQKEVFERCLFGHSADSIREYIYNLIKDVKAGVYGYSELGISSGINKSTYDKSMPIHVRAAFWSNDYLKTNFKVGDKVVMYFGHIPGYPKTDVFALPWGVDPPENVVLDWTRTIQRTVIMPLAGVLDILNLSEQEILSPTKKLTEFF